MDVRQWLIAGALAALGSGMGRGPSRPQPGDVGVARMGGPVSPGLAPQPEPQQRSLRAEPMIAAERGTVRGTVRAVHLARGEVVVASAGEDVALRGTPDQLVDLRPGERVSLPFAAWGHDRWLALPPDPALLDAPFARQGTLTGTVRWLDKGAGVLSLWIAGRRITVHGHPDQLQALLPGELISLQFRRVGPRRWLGGAAPEPAPLPSP